MDAEQRLKIIIQKYKAGMRRINDSMKCIEKLNNDYLNDDARRVKFALEQYHKELEDELFRVRKEKAR